MPLCIAGVAMLGWWTMGLTLPTAVLLGALLGPTDPVLDAGNAVAGCAAPSRSPEAAG